MNVTKKKNLRRYFEDPLGDYSREELHAALKEFLTFFETPRDGLYFIQYIMVAAVRAELIDICLNDLGPANDYDFASVSSSRLTEHDSMENVATFSESEKSIFKRNITMDLWCDSNEIAKKLKRFMK